MRCRVMLDQKNHCVRLPSSRRRLSLNGGVSAFCVVPIAFSGRALQRGGPPSLAAYGGTFLTAPLVSYRAEGRWSPRTRSQEGRVNNRPKVLIVGAGPTGLVMAHELARDGIDCRVADKSAHRAMQSRAIAIHSRTIETFELMGLADDFLRAGHRIVSVNVYGENERIAHPEFGMRD